MSHREHNEKNIHCVTNHFVITDTKWHSLLVDSHKTLEKTVLDKVTGASWWEGHRVLIHNL